MEDEDVDCITKIDAVSVADNKLPCVPVSKDINKIDSPDNDTINPSKEDVNDKNIVNKLKSVSNHHDSLNTYIETKDSVCSELKDSTVGSPKKVNGEFDKGESVVSEEDSYDCKKSDEVKDDKKTDKSNDDLKTEEVLVSEIEPTNKRKHPSSDVSDECNASDDESENKTSSGSSPVEFRGFKKRKILETEREKVNFCEVGIPDENEKNVVCEPVKPKVPELRRSARNATMAKRKSNEQAAEHKEENGDQLTEYAQYLGLQPTVKFKCGRCGEKHFQSMASLNAHQKICSKSSCDALVKPPKPPGDSNLSTNFRITRKVYLCSACGTYYENWKLFLHMRDMHKRHICLFCLGMFSIADKLAEHLLFKHNVNEKTCKSPEEFLSLFKGSCYLTCCSCEKMFTEREDFFDHQCKDPLLTTSNKDSVCLISKDNAQKCSLCGIKCGHFQTCPSIHSNKFPNATTPSTSVNTPSSTQTSSNMSLTKFYIPVPTSVQKEWNNTNIIPPNDKATTGDKDELYDISNAASFCHVDIANDSDTPTPSDKLECDKRISEHKTNSRLDNCEKSPLKSSDGEENITNEEPSKTALSNNEISSSLDESVREKNENSSIETSQAYSNENQVSEKDESEKNDNDDVNEQDVDMNENDTDDEQNSSEESTTKPEKLAEKADSSRSPEAKSSDANGKSYEDENSLMPCYIKLNRMEEKLDDTRTMEDSSSKTDDEKIDNSKEESIPVSCSENSDKVDINDISNSNNNSNCSSPNLDTNSLNNDSDSPEDEKSVESSSFQVKSPNDSTDVAPNTDKENVNSEDLRLNNSASPSFVENGFESKESKDLLDKSDESEDSDKLSVVLSEDAFEDNEKDKRNDMMSVDELENSNQETNSDNENSNSVKNEIFKPTEISNNDSNVLQNGSETVDHSNNLESQDNSNSSTSTRKEDSFKIDGENFQLASEEVMAMALTLEDKMDSLSSRSVIKECVRTSCTTCSYCNHAIKIGVNGRQLALHLLAEHRYMPVKNETVEDVIERLKNSLDELQDTWFNTDSYDSADKSCFVPYDHTYDCFQCNYVSNLHKDLYLHYRKVHQKSILYCCMCKGNFSSYSELICHMCPGLYVSKDIQFRCCFCELDRIPSAFRLMVHLRKSHHTCDICLEIAEDQQKLSTHMWKHKLNHSCYRCGISYRNKPDITKHLFWKHGTESVLCKKCLHKRWPHVYHFCVPPTVFICEECNLSFSKAVVLKVHKRMHSGDLPYSCTSCEQKFVSKRLLSKHEKTHNDVPCEDSLKTDVLPVPEDSQKTIDVNLNKVNDVTVPPTVSPVSVPQETEKPVETPVKQHKKKNKKDKEKRSKPVVDVYDLPPLNLSSESDDSDDEKEVKNQVISNEENLEKKEKEIVPNDNLESNNEGNIVPEDTTLPSLTEEHTISKTSDASATIEPGVDNEENIQPVTVVDGIWDSFHSYKAEQEKRENLDNNKQSAPCESDATPPVNQKDAFLGDHDYCVTNNVNELSVDENTGPEKPTAREHSSSIDHDYCTLNNTDGTGSLTSTPLNQEKPIAEVPAKKKQKSPKKKGLKQHNSSSSSDSSSDSDSSCSCGDSSCSCSSSSSNSSSSSSTDSDSSSSAGRRQNSSISKREKKRDKLKNKRKEDAAKTAEPLPAAEEEPVVDLPVYPEEPMIKESDLETDETSTDEEFYDKYPQRHAVQALAEKRNQLMVLAAVATVNNGTDSPPVPFVPEPAPPSPPQMETSPPATPVPPIKTTIHPQSKRKVKSKKRKKSSQISRSAAKSQNVSYETPQPSTSFATNHREQMVTNSPYPAPSPMMTPVSHRGTADNNMFLSSQTPQNLSANTQSLSSKRQSKRRPVRNKFYGYSSEEEDEQNVRRHPPPSKWKKTTADVNVQQHVQQAQPQPQFHHLPQQQLHVQQPQQFQVTPSPAVPEYNLPKMAQQPIRTVDEHINTIISDRLTTKVSSSGTSSSSEEDSESDSERTTINPAIPPIPSGITTTASEKDDKLYCYCQCPYDEVSEMIACDGVDCAIEWFHFECVGIMVPPKGKWYCPDCRKRRGLS